MMYNGNYFWGMDLIWWIIWFIFMFWIFATPYYVPGQQKKINSPLGILRKRFASGEISKEDYEERKKILEIDISKS